MSTSGMHRRPFEGRHLVFITLFKDEFSIETADNITDFSRLHPLFNKIFLSFFLHNWNVNILGIGSIATKLSFISILLGLYSKHRSD